LIVASFILIISCNDQSESIRSFLFYNLSLLTSCNFGGCSKNDVWGRIRVKCIVHLYYLIFLLQLNVFLSLQLSYSIFFLCFLMVVVQIHGFCWVLEYYSILFVFLYFFDYFLTVFLFISSSYFLSFLSFNPSSTTVYSETQHSIFLAIWACYFIL